LWASERADELLGITRNGKKRVPAELEAGAHGLASLLGAGSQSRVPPARLEVSRPNAESIRIELRLVRSRRGARFVVAEIEDPEASKRLSEIAERHRLTKSETRVLHLISLGLSDKEMARRLFVSPSTVHTHVNHVLGKLAVKSRVQAALLAHGREVSTGVPDS
jgi:DNA-binding CsgD family transcriptional regulator